MSTKFRSTFHYQRVWTGTLTPPEKKKKKNVFESRQEFASALLTLKRTSVESDCWRRSLMSIQWMMGKKCTSSDVPFRRRVNTVLKHWNESYGETTNEIDDDDRLTWWRQGQLQKTEKGTWLLICSIMEMLTPTILNEPFLSLAFQLCYYHESCIFPFILIYQTCHFNPFSTPFCFFSPLTKNRVKMISQFRQFVPLELLMQLILLWHAAFFPTAGLSL